MTTFEALVAAAASAPDELRRKALLLLTGTPANELDPERELTTEQVCSEFGIVRQTLNAKKVPCVKIAGRNRYRLSVVREALKNKKRMEA